MNMKSVLRIAAVSATLSSTSLFAASNACNWANEGLCAETNSAEIQFDCSRGTVVDQCSAEGRTGTCQFGDEASGVSVRFYPAFTEDAKAGCEEEGGTYTAGK